MSEKQVQLTQTLVPHAAGLLCRDPEYPEPVSVAVPLLELP